MKYDYMRAVQELKVAMSVEDIHVVLENCTKIALEYLNRGEGFHISPKNCKRKRDWQSQVFMELKRIFQCIEEGHEIVSRRVGIYDAEHDTFQMAEGVGEITTAWTERYKAERERMWEKQANEMQLWLTREEDPELVAMRKEYEILKKIKAYIDAHIHEPAHRVEPYAEYADETYSDDSGDNSQAQQDIPDNHTQEERTMTRTTVSEAVTAVKEATTTESIRDALMACTVKDMVKVCAEVTGVENAVKTGGLKAQTAGRIADFIMRHRKEESFKALPVAEKYMAMTEKKYSEICHLSSWCSVEELKEIALMLNCPLDEKYAKHMEYCLSRVNDTLWALNMERRIMERITAGADKEAVKNELKLTSRGVHEALMRRAGIELEGALPSDVVIERLASYFIKCNQPTPLANPEPEKRTATFKPGITYCYGLPTHNPSDIEYFVPCCIVSRTANSVVFFDAEKGINIRKRIYVNDRWGEYFYPFGRYEYAVHVSAFDTQERIEQRQGNSSEHVILCNAPTLKPSRLHEENPPTPPEQFETPAPGPEINPEDTSLAEYEMLQAWINVSMSVRSALKTAMKLLDPKSKDYSVLDELYYCEGRDIEEYVERRKVIHKAITALRGVKLKENNLLGVA